MARTIITGAFPSTRPRRLRQADWVRRLVRETRPTPDDLVWGLIVHDGPEKRIPVRSMPGVDRLNIDEAAKAAVRARELGIPALAIFPHIRADLKDEAGSEAANPDGLVPNVIRAMKAAAPDVGVACDVALDPFTSHGHDGRLDDTGYVVNDETVAALMEQALIQARAGADIVAPSDMMDGRVGAIRDQLDEEGFDRVMILSYAAKYASAFYGPYRDAVGTASTLRGDKKTYQMDFGNTQEALRETAMDIEEGADLVMVKPGLPYLDIVRRVSEEFGAPTLVFQISGEYAQIKAAAAQGWLDEDRAIIETMSAFKRAGASGVITYFAERAAQLLG
ncbi:MAG: porphobilinogen synthase [Alphaproteobacteria bacterium]|nr:porphobilinogen synthase [Alphaproteobacteria bacterium]